MSALRIFAAEGGEPSGEQRYAIGYDLEHCVTN